MKTIQPHDPGYYMVAGYDYHFSGYWHEDAWLLKVDEVGELAWPIKTFGEPSRDEVVSCIAAAITFPEPLPAGLTLYRMPTWTAMSHTVVDPHTIELSLWVASGSVNLAFVLAATAPLPFITSIEVPNASRVSLTFRTTLGLQYRVHRTLQLAPAGWADVPQALALGDPAALDTVAGTGAAVTVFVELPAAGNAFYRLTMEQATP